MISSGVHRVRGTEARAGALWGLACGDVTGAGRAGQEVGQSLAVWDAAAEGVDDLEAFAEAVLEHLLSWHAEGDGLGRTGSRSGSLVGDLLSLSTVRRNGDIASWPRLAVPERAGHTVVRAAWLGVHPDVPVDRLAVVARTQALVTDAHPVSPVAAQVAAALTRALSRGEAVPGRVAGWVRCYLAEARVTPPDPLLERVAGPEGAVRHLYAGWSALDELLLGGSPHGSPRGGSHGGDDGAVPPDSAGGALAVAVHLLDGGDDPASAVDRAALRGGGSASAASLTGAFLGAARGPVLGTDWVSRLPSADREALTLRECGDAPRRFTTPWASPTCAVSVGMTTEIAHGGVAH